MISQTDQIMDLEVPENSISYYLNKCAEGEEKNNFNQNDKIIRASNNNISNTSLCFTDIKLCQSNNGSWKEYYFLYEIKKSNIESLFSIKSALNKLIDIFGSFEETGYNSIGLQEFSCNQATNYYALIYVIKNLGNELINDEEKFLNLTNNYETTCN